MDVQTHPVYNIVQKLPNGLASRTYAVVTCEKKLFRNNLQSFISHVTTSETGRKIIISATMNTLENIHELPISLRNNSEITSGQFRQAEIKLFLTDVDEG